jgi:hypothetical protein
MAITPRIKKAEEAATGASREMPVRAFSAEKSG